jgi:hypothetical protein
VYDNPDSPPKRMVFTKRQFPLEWFILS